MKQNLLKFTAIAILGVIITLSSCKTDPIEPTPVDKDATTFVKDANGNIVVTDKGKGTGNYTFKESEVYVLNGLVFVNDGQTLTIEPGTLIKGKPGTGESASALVVARGGKIMAAGTAEKPIIFTAEADNREGTGVSADARGLWGGVIMLGKATTNNLTTDKAIEGISTSEARGLYGGNNDADNSGTLKYVSIRHGGTDIGEGNEINGLTLGAVGSGTTIDYLEVIANNDDGIEFFGGSVFVKHALIVKCKDDSYDYDQGFHGKGQFWLTIQAADSDRGGEHDGGPKDNEIGTPYAKPEIYNATYISVEGGESKTFTLRDNAGVTYANSIFMNFDKGVDIEYLEDGGTMAGCSYKMWEDGYVHVQNNVFYNVAGQTDGSNVDASVLFKVSTAKDADGNHLPCPQTIKDAWALAFAGNTNKIADPGVTANNPVPTNAQTDDMATYPSGFENVSYKGAFGSSNWAAGWTLTFPSK